MTQVHKSSVLFSKVKTTWKSVKRQKLSAKFESEAAKKNPNHHRKVEDSILDNYILHD